jgi:hypothetical protein
MEGSGPELDPKCPKLTNPTDPEDWFFMSLKYQKNCNDLFIAGNKPSGGMASKSGDWICGSCNKNNFPK